MKFNFSAPITKMTSYGLVAINIAQRADCTIFPIGQVDKTKCSPKIIESLNSENFDPNLPSVRLYHQFDLAPSIGRGERIGFPIFELDKFNKTELAHLKSCDKLVVCSEWAREVIKSNNIDVPTFVAPLGVDRSIFHEVDYTPHNFVFFSTGKWEIRKSQNEIVYAFNKAFNINDNVELWMSMHNIFLSKDQMISLANEYLDTPMGRANKIKLLPPSPDQLSLCRLMRMSSCGIFPSKAEGWGLGTLEMMACGKPVIVTNYSGHTEYCNSKNSMLLDVDKLEIANDNKWFFGQGNWAHIDIDKLIDIMRAAHKKGDTVNTFGIETSKKFSWENTLKQLECAINNDIT